MIFLLRGCMIFIGEVALFAHSLTRVHDFFLWRGCLIFLWRLHDFCGERLRDFYGGSMIFCVVMLCDFLCAEVAGVFVRGGCMMFLGGEVALFLTHLLSRLQDFFGGEVA